MADQESEPMSRMRLGPSRPEVPERLERVQLERDERRLRLSGVFYEGFQPRDSRTLDRIPLTERDTAVIFFISSVTVAPVDVLAARFFATNPQTGKVNTKPEQAARSRLDKLVEAGWLHAGSIPPSSSKEPGGWVYVLGKESAVATNVRLSGVAGKRMHHHLQTLRTIDRLRQELEKSGRSIAKVELERGEMASHERNLGRHVPDAIVTVDDGSIVAIEYVSTDYSDKRIAEKSAYFAERYDQVRWSANSRATQTRVVRMTSQACDVIA